MKSNSKILILASVVVLGAVCIRADYSTLMEGYAMSTNAKAPKGNEWNNPAVLGLNKEMPRSWFFSFDTRDNARKVLPENSVYWKSLDGMWKFHFSKSPDERPQKFYRTDFDDSGGTISPCPATGVCRVSASRTAAVATAAPSMSTSSPFSTLSAPWATGARG